MFRRQREVARLLSTTAACISCACVRACTCMRHAHKHANICAHTHEYLHIPIDPPKTHTHACTHECTHACTHACTHECTHECTYGCTHGHTHAQIHVPMHASTHALPRAHTHGKPRTQTRTMLVSRPLRPGLVLVDVGLMLRRGWEEENSRGWAYMSRSGEKSERLWNHRLCTVFDDMPIDVEIGDTDLQQMNTTDECGWIRAASMGSGCDMTIMGWW